MTVIEKVSAEIMRRSQECERGVIAVGVSEHNPEMGFGLVLVAPNCLLFAFTPGPEIVLDLYLN